VALEAGDARVAVELERFGPRHNPQSVVGMAAPQASALDAAGEPVRGAAVRDEAVRSALREKARRCGAVSGLREVARRDR
jgi:hypothetical protein